MKRSRSLAMGIACAAGCAICTGAFLVQVSDQAEAARAEALARYGGDQLEVCVARRDIAPGETIDEGAVTMGMWVADLLPDGVVTARGEVVGKQASAAILKGEALTVRRIGAGLTPTLDIPEGLAAVSVPAREVQAVGATELIVPRALVVATSTDTSGALASGAVEWVTLAVAPSAVQELVSAAQSLEIYFVLPTDVKGPVRAEA